MMVQQMQRIRNVINTYTVIPGLFLAVMGFYFAFNGALSVFWLHWGYNSIEANPALHSYIDTFINVVLWVPAVLLCTSMVGVALYYQHRIGQVKDHPVHRAWVIGIMAATFIGYFVMASIDVRLRSPLSMAILVVAAFFIMYWWLQGRTHNHYLILAAIAVACSFMPLVSAPLYHWLYLDKAPDWYGNNVNICMGLLLGSAGLLDHWLLLRNMARVRQNIQQMTGNSKIRA